MVINCLAPCLNARTAINNDIIQEKSVAHVPGPPLSRCCAAKKINAFILSSSLVKICGMVTQSNILLIYVAYARNVNTNAKIHRGVLNGIAISRSIMLCLMSYNT